MDKAEYQEKLEELTGYMNDKDYESALSLANEIDWKRVKSIRTLNMVADVYEKNREYDDARRILKLALSRASVGRTILGRLVEVSIKLGEMGDAEEYFDQFNQVAGNDNSRYVLQYKMFKAKRAPLDAQISVLEEYRDREYTEKWAYELASLYAKAGDEARCVEACDDLILWFGGGKYVLKAMELKMKYEPLTSSQRRMYEEERAKAEKEAAASTRMPEIEDESPDEMKDKLAESFQDVFSGIRREQPVEEEPSSKFDNTMPLDQLHISDLEPEHAESPVVDTGEIPEVPEVIVSEPDQPVERAEVPHVEEEEERVWTDIGINKKTEETAKQEEVDLDSLLQETAGDFSKEISSGIFGTAQTVQGSGEELVQPEASAEKIAQPEAVAEEIAQTEASAEDIEESLEKVLEEAPAAETFISGETEREEAAPTETPVPEVIRLEGEEDAALPEAPEEAPAEEEEEQEAKPSLWSRIRNSVRKMTAQVKSDEPIAEPAAEEAAPDEGPALDEAEAAAETPEKTVVPPVIEAEREEVRAHETKDKAPEAAAEAPAAEPDTLAAVQAITDETKQRRSSSFRDSIRAALERDEEERRREAEQRARREAEEAARREVEAANARREAEEAARRAAEQLEARRAADEQARREAEEQARIEAEERARREAEEAARKEAEEKAAAEAAAVAAAVAAEETAAADEPAAEVTEEPVAEEVTEEPAAEAAEEAPQESGPHYNEELEIPDPEMTEEEKRSHSHTLDLSKVGENTIPASLDEIMMNETPEERRIRFLHTDDSLRMNDDQRRIFTYFARIPGMDNQILSAMTAVYQHADEHTSSHGNFAVMGAQGSGKSKLVRDMISAMCMDLGMTSAKIARITGYQMNQKDPVQVVARMAGGFLMIEECSEMTEETVEKLNQAMDFRTDRMILILEDEKAALRGFLRKYSDFAKKIEKVISIPIFTNDELITFARTYAGEKGYTLDDMAVLALYTIIGNNQSYEQPMTISKVKTMIDQAINRAGRGQKRSRRGRRGKGKADDMLVLQEKDFAND